VNIRAITTLMDVNYPLNREAIQRAGERAGAVRAALTEGGFNVQTVRLATLPLIEIVARHSEEEVVAFVHALEEMATSSGFEYCALGPVRLDDAPDCVDLVPPILEATASVFCSIEIARKGIGLSLPQLRAAASVIRQAGAMTQDGFSNLRLAVLANVAPWAPFFPAAYHGGGPARIALAIEGADLAVDVFREAGSLQAARARLIELIEDQARHMQRHVEGALEGSDTLFEGIDFTLGSFPERGRSIAEALEMLGLETFGGSGSLLAAAFLTDTLDRARFKRTGFCGLMLPVLEDSTLAERAAEGRLRIGDLLTLSAVCGTGLDTIPLPGDTTEGQIAAILADVGALALRLDKQLTARLMPLPGKKAGDLTAFDFEYFANSRVLPAPSSQLTRLLSLDELLDIQPRPTIS
jgi:uncharacterized protein